MIHRATMTGEQALQNRQLLQSADLRELVFASGVLLVEGTTEQQVLDVWLADPGADQPSRTEAGIGVVSVNGDKSFPRYVALLDDLGIPWAILADAPAFAPKGPLWHLPNRPELGDVADFGAVRDAWQPYGVFSLVKSWRNSGDSESGEIESYLRDVDPAAWAATASPGKPRRGTEFALAVSTPAEVRALWEQVLLHVGVRN